MGREVEPVSTLRPHEYGPHDAELEPKTVHVHVAIDGVRYDRELLRTPAQLKQRRDLNNLAWKASRRP